jgi:hypothetical protein
MRRTSKAWPSLLMLLFVTGGLFTMHTLGHFTDGAAMRSGQTAASMIIAEPDEGEPAALTESPGKPSMPMGGIVACVAILCGLTVLAMAAMLHGRARLRHLAMPSLASVVMDAVRGPPKIRIGLAIADLAVLRN